MNQCSDTAADFAFFVVEQGVDVEQGAGCDGGALFDDLGGLTSVGPDCHVLEIGCGTGQATAPLAQRGGRVVAVELGPVMAAVARRNLAAFPTVQVVTSAFEDWPLPIEPFDLVFAGVSINPERSSVGRRWHAGDW